MRIVVTGATGFMGRNLVEQLHRDGHQVRATGRSVVVGRELQQLGIDFRPADLTDAAQTSAAVGPADCLVHCAGKAGDWGRADDFHAVNVVGTRHVVRACARHGIGRIVFVSTPSVYDTGRDRFYIRETDPLPSRQLTHYARTKLLAEEELLAVSRSGPQVIILRPRAVYGPHDQTILPRILRFAGRPRFPLIDGGRALVDITSVDHFVDAVRASLAAPSTAWNRAYNISNGDPVRVRDWFATILGICGRPFRPVSVPVTAAVAVGALMEAASALPGGPREPPLTRFSVGYMARSMTLSLDRARRRLGYQPRYTNQETFQRFARWWRTTHRAAPTRR